MRQCRQTPTQSVLEHCQSVSEWYLDLHGWITEGQPLAKSWWLPPWLSDVAPRNRLANMQLPLDITMTYLAFHDCGKPLCAVCDLDGRMHFPDHAAVSKQLWLRSGGDERVGELIGADMDIHILPASDVVAFARRPEAPTLLLAGLSEVHSNAELFGGVNSVGFKIKWKHITQRGKALMRYWNGNGS
jgi:hypothetical protein